MSDTTPVVFPRDEGATATLRMTHPDIQRIDHNTASMLFTMIADDWARQGKGQLQTLKLHCGDCCGPCVYGPEPWKRIKERLEAAERSEAGRV